VFERLTREVRAAVVGAHETARECGAGEVTPTHLLSELARGDGLVPVLLRRHGIEAERIAGLGRLGEAEESPARHPLDDDDAEALRSLGIDLGAIRRAVEASFGEGALDDPTRVGEGAGTDGVITDDSVGRQGRLRISLGGRPRFGAAAKKSIELALREAIRDRSREVREEHLARGILRDDDDDTRALLRALDVDVRTLRQDLEGRSRESA
jgi:Clp amino terminal domain, pathogenicity island component